MISEKYNCIFVHIPMTAGQSIEHFFLTLHGLSWLDRAPLLLKYNPNKEKGPMRLAHLFASEYVSCGHIDKKRFKDYFKFTFVRNSWARLVSEYYYRNYHDTMSFKDFVLNGLPTKSLYTGSYRHIIPQYDFLYDKSDNLLVDFVGKFEQLQEDFDYVCSKINIDESKLPHVNSSNKSATMNEKTKNLLGLKRQRKQLNYTDYYDDDILKVANKMYAKDIATFGYVFGE